MVTKAPIPTHKVSFYGVRCYWNDHTGDLWGTNPIFECLIPVVTFLHNFFVAMVPGAGENGFPLVILNEYDRNGKIILRREA